MKKILILKTQYPETVATVFAALAKDYEITDFAKAEFLERSNFLDVKLENENFDAQALFFPDETISAKKLHLFLQPSLNVHYGINRVESPQIFIATNKLVEILPGQEDYVLVFELHDYTRRLLPEDCRLLYKAIRTILQYHAIPTINVNERNAEYLRNYYNKRYTYFMVKLNNRLIPVSTPA